MILTVLALSKALYHPNVYVQGSTSFRTLQPAERPQNVQKAYYRLQTHSGEHNDSDGDQLQPSAGYGVL